MEDFKTWFEKRHGISFPGLAYEPQTAVLRRLADSVADYVFECRKEMVNLMQPPQMIIPAGLPDASMLKPGKAYPCDKIKTAHQIMQEDAELQRTLRMRKHFDAALEDAAQHGAGFLRIKPDGSAERIAPEDWREDTNDPRLTQTSFNCACCFKTKWFAGAGEDYEKAEELAKGVGWIFADGWGWFCCETCRAWEVDDA